MYLALAVVVCTALSLLTPPLWAPDEPSHVCREIEVGRGEWLARMTPSGAGGEIDRNFQRLLDGITMLHADAAARTELRHVRPDHLVTEAQLVPLQQMRWAGATTFFRFQNTAVYPPFLYLPEALALRLARAADLTIVHSLWLARLGAMLCSLGLGWMALRLGGSSRWLIFAYLLVPTLLGLEASCSQDALLLPLPVIVLVLVSRAMAASRTLRGWELGLCSLLLMACIGARSPYLPLAFVLVLPALELPGRLRWRELMPAGVAILGIVAAVALWLALVHPLGLFSLPAANPGAQLRFLKDHPVLGLLRVARGTAVTLPGVLVKGLGLMGGNDVFPPHLLYGALFVALAGVWTLAPRASLRRGRSRIVLGLILLAIVAGISVAEYLIWTPVGVAEIGGLQARYYLPLLPFAAMLLPGLMTERCVRDEGAGWKKRALSGLVAALVCIVLAMPWVVANHVYGIGLGEALMAAIRR